MSVRQEIEIAELQQALFDVYVALGEDTDGIPDGPTFARTVSPYPECIVEAARLTRKEYEDETDALTAQLQAARDTIAEMKSRHVYQPRPSLLTCSCGKIICPDLVTLSRADLSTMAEHDKQVAAKALKDAADEAYGPDAKREAGEPVDEWLRARAASIEQTEAK